MGAGIDGVEEVVEWDGRVRGGGLKGREGRGIRTACGYAFGVVVQVLRDDGDAGGTNDCAAAVGHDVGPEGDHEQGLLGGVEVVDEEVALDNTHTQLAFS